MSEHTEIKAQIYDLMVEIEGLQQEIQRRQQVIMQLNMQLRSLKDKQETKE